MQILLNGEEFDIQLEDERLLAEVLREVINWLESDSHYLTELIIDGSPYFAAKQGEGYGEWDFECFQQELSEIGSLELFSEPMLAYKLEANEDEVSDASLTEQQDTTLKSIKILADYFQIAKKAFEDQQFVFLQDFFSDSAALLELLESSVSKVEQCLGIVKAEAELPYENPLCTELRAVLELWNYFREGKQNALLLEPQHVGEASEAKQRVQVILDDALSLLAELYKDYELWLEEQDLSRVEGRDTAAVVPDLGNQAALSVQELRGQLAEKSQELIEELSHLQSGQMQQSLYHLSGLSLLLEQLLQQEEVQGRQVFAELFTLLKPFLHDLAEAIKNTDTVMIGDLVEYEIVPLIQQIIDELG